MTGHFNPFPLQIPFVCYNLNMHSEKSMNIQKDKKRTFIEEARRTQIIEAAIDVLNEVGYAKASLAKIAKKCGMSTSLTLYHFDDRQALMTAVLRELDHTWNEYVNGKLSEVHTVRERLHTYIEANLAFMGTRPKYFGALIELNFNARDLKTGLSFHDSVEDTLLDYLKNLLTEGQKCGNFKTDFDPSMMALSIRGAIDQYLGYSVVSDCYELEAYTDHVITIYDQVIIKETT